MGIRGLKPVLTELGSGYAARKPARGVLVTFKNGAATYRFAEGCAIPVRRGGERSC
jgi:hypothetical protein